ncbi:uncharacterized protein LOC119741665 [Patiria miniata]|uniref:Uncharacterized protein n=1 Tax=Patiria miniata TaxID=46514 RepID=A0A913ZKY4_PATMI|nr:uncharacterized protein LOC119724666 [Patiria miniata]XP_038065986.1 uncharacterized protein LOC119736054 [Patiria miniata]XP_038071109.1 uncharacterized protein LOC119740001 [Patiria miniata]XP_038073433.1 uncharacterized protein LOC119741665 [Patiria miniata]
MKTNILHSVSLIFQVFIQNTLWKLAFTSRAFAAGEPAVTGQPAAAHFLTIELACLLFTKCTALWSRQEPFLEKATYRGNSCVHCRQQPPSPSSCNAGVVKTNLERHVGSGSPSSSPRLWNFGEQFCLVSAEPTLLAGQYLGHSQTSSLLSIWHQCGPAAAIRMCALVI